MHVLPVLCRRRGELLCIVCNGSDASGPFELAAGAYRSASIQDVPLHTRPYAGGQCTRLPRPEATNRMSMAWKRSRFTFMLRMQRLPSFGIEHCHLVGSPGRTEAARGRRTVLTNSMRCEASVGRFERESPASRCRQSSSSEDS